MTKTSMGINENIASMLCYLLGWVGGIVFFVIEKDNKTVRFNALQSICFFGPLSILSAVIGWIGFLDFITWAISVINLVGIIYLSYSAYKGKVVKVPILGDACYKQIFK